MEREDRVDLFDEIETDEKSARVLQKLEEREAQYKQKQFRTEEEKLRRANNDSLFFEPFELLEKEFNEKLSKVQSANSVSNIEVDEMLLILQKMQTVVSSNTRTLSAYDIKHSETIINNLRNSLLQTKEKLTPTKKFSFKRSAKTAPAEPKPIIAVNTHIDSANKSEGATFIDERNRITKITNSKIIISSAGLFVNDTKQTETKDLSNEFHIRELDNCQVEVYGNIQNLHVNTIKNSRISVSPVARSTIIDYCESCVFQFASQQIRIHNSSDCTFYLLTKSGPIIEDCNNIRFGVYSFSLVDLTERLREANLDIENNNWDKVQDFNWLKSTPSPHFTLLEKDQ